VGIALAALVVAFFGGGYLYYFSGLHSTPKPLTLKSPTPRSSSVPVATTSPSQLAGQWTVGTGSLAGYRVQEQFVGQSSPHDAVARTSQVSGGMTVAQTSSGLVASNLRFDVQLGQLHSVDQVAGFNVTNRDHVVLQDLDVAQYPNATFQAQSVALPAGVTSGSDVTLEVPGTLTIHGVAKAVTATVQLQISDGHAAAAGSIPIVMTDFGVQPPQVPFTTVQPSVTVEFSVNLSRT
jgi:polyisoprenoid-binding protein YceI